MYRIWWSWIWTWLFVGVAWQNVLWSVCTCCVCAWCVCTLCVQNEGCSEALHLVGSETHCALFCLTFLASPLIGPCFWQALVSSSVPCKTDLASSNHVSPLRLWNQVHRFFFTPCPRWRVYGKCVQMALMMIPASWGWTEEFELDVVGKAIWVGWSSE
jgi:hypothetical protein